MIRERLKDIFTALIFRLLNWIESKISDEEEDGEEIGTAPNEYNFMEREEQPNPAPPTWEDWHEWEELPDPPNYAYDREFIELLIEDDPSIPRENRGL